MRLELGRGHSYHRLYGVWEVLAERFLGSGWTASLAHGLGLQRGPHVTRHDFEVEGLTHPLKFAFASDLHSGPFTHPAHLDLVAEALTAADVDVLLLGGDYVTHRARNVLPLTRLLGRVPARIGRFAVLGNHDLWADDGAIVAAFEENGVRVLVNEGLPLPAPFGGVSLVGLDDPRSGRPDAARALAGAEAVRIVLMHAPSGLLSLGAHDFRVAFAGHTHGGQICLPGGTPVFVGSGPLSRKYAKGRFHVGNGRELVVSRGAGFSDLPIRAFSPPEVVVGTFLPRRSPSAS